MIRAGIALFMLLLSAGPTLGADNPLWVQASGSATMGEMDTPKEVKARARRDAQNSAVEKAVGVFIKSHTLVSNNQVADDLVYAAVRGVVEKMEVIQEGWEDKDRNTYRVTMKAQVRPVYPERGEGLSLQLSLSKTELKAGEETKIFYRTNADAYIYIFSVAADGSVTLLVPNQSHQDNHIAANKNLEFPPADSPLRLTAQFLPGCKEPWVEEKIKVIATKQKEELIPLGFREGMVKIYDANSTGMINDLVKRLNQLDPASWTDATVVYKIMR